MPNADAESRGTGLGHGMFNSRTFFGGCGFRKRIVAYYGVYLFADARHRRTAFAVIQRKGYIPCHQRARRDIRGVQYIIRSEANSYEGRIGVDRF